jgi:NADP-dependent 3-hydroxy acid dehydrogenase YdfG
MSATNTPEQATIAAQPNANQPIAMVTGATSGIGLATAKALAGLGYNLIITGRRADRLAALQAELTVPSLVLVFDVADREAVKSTRASLPEAWQSIDVLVNNAGNAHGLASSENADLDDWDAMIDINVKGLLYVTKAVLPQMVSRQSGHIINISSIAGRETYANGAVYCASKAAVDRITAGMRIDLNPHNIKVASIAPGMVDTEFSLVRFKGDAERAGNVYKGLSPLSADDVADAVVYMVTRPAHVNIADILILPTAQASATVVKRVG